MTILIDYLGTKQKVDMVPKAIPHQLERYLNEEVFIIDSYRNKNFNKFLENDNFNYIYHYPFDEKFKTYNDVVEDFKKVLIDNNIKTYIFYLFQPNTQFNIRSTSVARSLVRKVSNGDFKRYSFVFQDKILCRAAKIMAALEVCDKVIQISWDNDEMILSRSFEDHGKAEKINVYISDTEDRKYMPVYEKVLHEMISNFDKQEKDLDFISYISALKTKNDLRKPLRDNKHYLESLNDNKFKLIVQESYKSDMIPQRDYYELLGKSKFTYIYLTYNEDSFSFIRLFEALYNDCVPILYDHKGLKHFQETFPDLFNKFVNNDLLMDNFDVKNIKNKVFTFLPEYDTILSDIQSSIDYKRVLDDKYIKNIYEEMLN